MGWGYGLGTICIESLTFIWNGKANWGGQRDLPSSDYYYIIKFNNDNYSDKTGVITLIR